MNYLKQILISKDERGILFGLNAVMDAYERKSVNDSTLAKALSFTAAKLNDMNKKENVFFFDSAVISWLTKPFTAIENGNVQDVNLFCAPFSEKNNMMVCHYGFNWVNAIHVPRSIPCGVYSYMPNAFALIESRDDYDPFDMFTIGMKAEHAFPTTARFGSTTQLVGLRFGPTYKTLFTTDPVDGQPQFSSRKIQQILSVQEKKMVQDDSKKMVHEPYKMQVYTNTNRDILFMKYSRGYSILTPEYL